MLNRKDDIENYNYPLPEDKIAKYPLQKRDESKLLVYKDHQIKAAQFKQIADFLPKNGLIVWNNTKVIRARTEFFKDTGARIEVFCLEPHQPADYNLNFSQNQSCTWQCIIGNLKKWKSGTLAKKIIIDNKQVTVTIERLRRILDAHEVKFSWDNTSFSFSEILENLGNIPIPPYLKRDSEKSDLNTYQTIYSKIKGSVAAPTAGLHFTESVFTSLQQKNIQTHEITLHVGAGTFKPVKTTHFTDHEMHTEQFIITEKTIPEILKKLGNITAVGTTTVRTLESLYWLGVKNINCTKPDYHITQWEAYQNKAEISVKTALQKVHEMVLNSTNHYINASTAIMIVPGYNFKLINRLITNFHQPKSTLLLLISAFIGEQWKTVYDYALNNNYRFLSYGDSNLYFKNPD